MTATDVELDEEALWLAWRREGEGASDIANAHTGAYGGWYAVVADKLGYETDDNKNKKQKDRGHHWEQRIADAVHALTGYYVVGEQLKVESAANPVHRFTADGFLSVSEEILSIDDADAVLEIKTKNEWVKGKRDYFNAQIQWQMHVAAKTRALLVVVSFTIDRHTGDEIVENVELEWVDRDDYLIGQLVETADRIWEYVQAGVLPEPDAFTPVAIVREVNRHGLRLVDHNGEEMIDPDVTIDDLADDLHRYHTKVLPAIKDLEQERKELEAKFRARMSGHVVAATRDGEWILRVGEPVKRFDADSETRALARFPQYVKTKFDKESFKADQPTHYESYKTPSNDRRLTVKFVKGPRVRARIAEYLAAPRDPDHVDAF